MDSSRPRPALALPCRRRSGQGRNRLAGGRRSLLRVVAAAAVTALPLLFLSAGQATADPTTTVATPAAASPSGWVRFGHFVPSSGPVNVTLDGTSLGTNLVFRDVTAYVPVPPGVHTVTLRSSTAPATTAAMVTGQATVPAGGAVTIAAVAPTGMTAAPNMGAASGGVALQQYTDDLSAPAPGQAKVRVVHTVPGAPQITAQLSASSIAVASSGTATAAPLTLSPVAYGQASPYISVAAGTYQVSVAPSAGGAPVVSGTNWPVSAGTVSSIVVVDASTGPTLEVLSDAVGAVNMPTGGMKTGLGGTAPRPEDTLRAVTMPLAVAIAALLVLGVYLRSRRIHGLKVLPISGARRLP